MGTSCALSHFREEIRALGLRHEVQPPPQRGDHRLGGVVLQVRARRKSAQIISRQ